MPIVYVPLKETGSAFHNYTLWTTKELAQKFVECRQVSVVKNIIFN